ncbi:MAG TPA: CoA ester lyase [Anaeromyxobacteraceae bacterium]|nr:CoA ester lyase [Anaeromyxobacteraceae bacterium]
MTNDRPRRSALYLPGSNARAIAKARVLPADAIILDLEDAVAPSAKEQARTLVVAALAEGGFGDRELVVRANAGSTPWGEEDLRAVARSRLHAVLLPKVESPDEVGAANEALRAAGAPDDLALWCMIETPRGVLAAPEIATASPRVAVLVAGTSDLVKDLRAKHTRERSEVLAALSWVVLSARAARVGALDGVHLDLDDDAGLEAACRQGRDLGFDGKTLIHPRQIEAANRAFAPTTGEVEAAGAIVDAYAAASAAGQGVTVVGGRLVEALHVEEARRVLALHGVIARRDTAQRAAGAARGAP